MIPDPSKVGWMADAKALAVKGVVIDDHEEHPRNILNTDNCEIWYKFDKTFKVDKVYIDIKMFLGEKTFYVFRSFPITSIVDLAFADHLREWIYDL